MENLANTDTKLVTKIDLNQLKIAIHNVKFALNKANKAGVYDLEESRAIATNIDYLNDHYVLLEKLSIQQKH